MNNERENLELAAKAAGYVPCGQHREGIGLLIQDENVGAVWWNPLLNKADTWDLAAKLEVMICFADKFVMTKTGKIVFTFGQDCECKTAEEAVVAVTAEIGRNMPCST